MTEFQQDENETPVIFRKERGIGGEVTAVFPCEPFSLDGDTMTCYSHIGQHSGCSFGWLNSSKHRPATPEEYADLKAELESKPYGYKLKVYKRLTQKLRMKFKVEWYRLLDKRG